MTTYVDRDTDSELVTVWNGALDAREACPRLSAFEYAHGRSPLAVAAAREQSRLATLPSLPTSRRDRW